MTEGRRSFLKKAAVVGAVTAVGAVSATASSKKTFSSNGVVVGKSPKKEITYTKTQAWSDYYKTAL
jgi:nitrous oxide reductase